MRELIQVAIAREMNGHQRSFDLDNVTVGFVLPNDMANLIYTNLDIHTTTEKDFSLAFLSDYEMKEFGGSVRLHDPKGTVCGKVRKDVEEVWRKIPVTQQINLGKHYSKYVKSAVAKDMSAGISIIETINSEIDKIVTELKK